MSNIDPAAQVLVVDDDEGTRDYLAVALRNSGCAVRMATNGEDALKLVLEQPPDLVLSDIYMAGLGGIEICRQLKSNRRTSHIPIVLMTAEPERARRIEAIEAGVDDLLTKPVEIGELLARTRVLIRSKRLDEEVRRQNRVLDSLLTISTLSPGYTDSSTKLFADFGQNAAKLLRANVVAVVLQRHGRAPQLLNCWPMAEFSATAEKLASSIALGAILTRGEPVIVENSNESKKRDLGLAEGFVGVPVLSFNGGVLGAVLAFGIVQVPEERSVQMLMALAQRVGSEIQLQDQTVHLESLVEERTQDLAEAKNALEMANEEMIFRLAQAVECRDQETGDHLKRIARFSEMLAEACGLAEVLVQIIRPASMLHDIGKLSIPEAILMKPEKLTPEEYDHMKLHTVVGAQILHGSSSVQLQLAERIALGHHEWWDGNGYPYGIRGERIPIEARIVAVADIFDALTSRRPYKEAWSLMRAFEHIGSLAGTQLDPNLVEVFIKNFDRVATIAAELSPQSVSLLDEEPFDPAVSAALALERAEKPKDAKGPIEDSA
jgi:response regulator RpfG family c-di-GMP phosphodiesterase